MSYVRMLVQDCKPGTVETLTRKAEETFVPQLRALPGFLSYRVVKVDDHTLIAMGFFETREAAEQMERLGSEWRRQYGKDAIISARPYIGEVILDARSLQAEAYPSP